MIHLPRLYAILDASYFCDSKILFSTAEELLAGGVTLLQYRNKSGNAREMLEQARELKRRLDGAKLIMNDRADLCLAAGFDGVHVGQEDLSPEGARKWSARTLARRVHPQSWADRGSRQDFCGLHCHRASVLDIEQGQSGSGRRPQRRPPSARSDPKAAGGHRRHQSCQLPVGHRSRADSVAVISDLTREPRKSAEDFPAS